ncbi:MAG TPA: hypothetical protein VNG12_14315 [Acidimicrobiales bacterium]|nr:hypothetical protein [Acidimicrobiales bacterium]
MAFTKPSGEIRKGSVAATFFTHERTLSGCIARRLNADDFLLRLTWGRGRYGEDNR